MSLTCQCCREFSPNKFMNCRKVIFLYTAVSFIAEISDLVGQDLEIVPSANLVLTLPQGGGSRGPRRAIAPILRLSIGIQFLQ